MIAFLLQKPFNYTFEYWFESSIYLFFLVLCIALLIASFNKLRQSRIEVLEYVDSIRIDWREKGLRWDVPEEFPRWIEIV